MRITLDRSGGFANMPALTGQLVIDTETLAQPAREDVERLAEAVDFAPSVATQAPALGSADHLNYDLTVHQDGAKVSRTFISPISDPDVQRLVARLEELARDGTGR